VGVKYHSRGGIAPLSMENKKKDNEEESKAKKTIVPPLYTPEEIKERSRLITILSTARDEREAPHAEFDDMTYSQYYDTNKRADMSYISPKKNRYDKRIVTGYTREKDNTLLSALLAYNFKPDITVYDDTEMVFPELGNHMEDIVAKSRELEQWDRVRPLIYRELISQGDVWVEEIWECIYTPDITNPTGWKPGDKISNAKFEQKVKPIKTERAGVRLHEGKNCYVGNFYEDDDKQQELKFTYELLPRAVAEAIYGTWDRWDNVPEEVDNTIVNTSLGYTYYNWNLTRTTKEYVGVLKIQEKFKNRYMIMLNGVMMLPVGYPLSAISPDGEATLKHFVLEGIVGCAYGKGQPSKTKVDQAVHDEFLRLMILRQEQAGAPPMGYKGKRVLGENIYNPGKITNNIREGDLFPILPPSTALNNADFSMYQLIKTMMDDKTINATFSGQDNGKGKVTATQIMQEKQQQLLKLGLNFDAVKTLEKELVWARIGNLILNYSKPKGKKISKDEKTIEDVYEQLSLESTLPDGRKGIKIFKFTDKEYPEIREHQKMETELSDYYGKPTQIVYFNGPEFIKLLKYRWIVNIVPTEESSDQIERQLFIDNIRDAQTIFGPQAINYDYAKERFAIHIKEDPSRFFIQDEGQSIESMLNGGATPVVGQGGAGASPAGAGGMSVNKSGVSPVN
jgi:hypothetical protein